MTKNLIYLKTIFFMSLVIVLINSCEKEKPVGYGTPPKFDTNTHLFSKNAVDTVMEAKNNVKWWFNPPYIDNKTVHFDDESLIVYREKYPSSSDSPYGLVYKFEYEWFSIEKLDNKQIRIILKENKTELIRTLTFSVQAGNASNAISLVQEK